MTTQLLAVYDAMTRAAADQRAARKVVIRLQAERRDAGLDPGALGKILPAHDLVETFREVNGATRAGLWEVAHRCEDLSDGVRELRNLYRKVDEAIADRFDSLAGGA